MLTIKQIQERHRVFWAEQNALRNKRIEDPILVKRLVRVLASPAGSWCSVEQTLHDLEQDTKMVVEYYEPSLRQKVLSEQARRARQSRKPDALQLLIIEFVRRNPSLTASQLLDKLREQSQVGSVIDGIEDGQILFRQRIGNHEFLKDAPVSGLKDRLSRAKKIFCSR